MQPSSHLSNNFGGYKLVNHLIVTRNGKMSGNTDHLHKNLFRILKFNERPKTPGIILRNMTSSEGDQLLAGGFHAILDNIEVDILQIVKKWN